MTFSLVGRCARTRMVGVAITTSSIAVGSRCPWVRAGAGAVSTQNVTLPSLGPSILDCLERGEAPEDAVRTLMEREKDRAYRQVVVIDCDGRTAHYTGEKILGTNAVAKGRDAIAAGNLLSTDAVPQAMVEAFEQAGEDRHLAERLLTGLTAGVRRGGEMGPVHSAALLVASELSWPLVDLRVDWDDEDPVARLSALWQAYEPQMMDYVSRALKPASAPSYGVPGDQ
jgi:uncharacterized Ntn-hydrolase superfamily protein